jgi:hypothetical protein
MANEPNPVGIGGQEVTDMSNSVGLQILTGVCSEMQQQGTVTAVQSRI